MPIASRSGTRSAIRRAWRAGDHPRSRPGPRTRPRPDPFAELAAGLQSLLRFHQSHPDWFPPAACSGGLRPSSPALSPEWEQAIRKAYHPEPVVPGEPEDVTAEGVDGRAALSGAILGKNLTS